MTIFSYFFPTKNGGGLLIYGEMLIKASLGQKRLKTVSKMEVI